MKKLLNKAFGKKAAFPTATAPRPAEEIMKAYYELRGRAGEAQYQVHIYKKELVRLNGLLENLNIEMTERQKLDQAKATEEAEKSAKVAEAAKTAEILNKGPGADSVAHKRRCNNV